MLSGCPKLGPLITKNGFLLKSMDFSDYHGFQANNTTCVHICNAEGLRAVQRPRVEQTDTKKSCRTDRLGGARDGCLHPGGARILKGEAYAAAGVYVVRRRAARWRQCSSPTLLRVSLAKTLG